MDFVVYKKFVEEEPAVELIKELRANNIEAELTQDRESLDSTLGGQKIFDREFFVKVKQDDIRRADALLEEKSKDMLSSVDSDHYLFAFSDGELLEVLDKSDEWNELDVQLAKKLLKDRGREVSDDHVAQKKAARLNTLAQPIESQPYWLYIGYFLALGGGPIGVIMGWHISTHKKPLPNGQMIYAFSPGDRMHGRVMLIIGVLVFVFAVAAFIKTF